MSIAWRLMKSVLFRMDAEDVHRRMVGFLRFGIQTGNFPLRIAAGAVPSAAAVRIWDMGFRSPVGLAAGFDKDAEIVAGLPALGFGFAEIGTVTPRPQPGNPRPRLFRDPARGAIFNRMGFNGLGAAVVSAHLEKAREKLPADFGVGVNLGKNKDTPLERAPEDYAEAARAFNGLADYLVVNVSSPNTPGLRILQSSEALLPILSRVKDVTSGWSRQPPLLVKLAPEVKGEELREIIMRLESAGVGGFILTNTLAGKLRLDRGGEELAGGWSGLPLVDESRARLKEARQVTKLPIISVGGIMTADEALARLEAGADLIQIYSGWIFAGPAFPAEIARKWASFRKS